MKMYFFEKSKMAGWHFGRSRSPVKSWSKVYKPYMHNTRKKLPRVIAPNSHRLKLTSWLVMRPPNTQVVIHFQTYSMLELILNSLKLTDTERRPRWPKLKK